MRRFGSRIAYRGRNIEICGIISVFLYYIANRLIPVSYPHLDVYKRQASEEPLCHNRYGVQDRYIPPVYHYPMYREDYDMQPIVFIKEIAAKVIELYHKRALFRV